MKTYRIRLPEEVLKSFYLAFPSTSERVHIFRRVLNEAVKARTETLSTYVARLYREIPMRGENSTRSFKIKLEIEDWSAFYAAFPGHGHRAALARLLIELLIESKARFERPYKVLLETLVTKAREEEENE